MAIRYELLGWAELSPAERAEEARHRDGPTVRLDWQQFAYAGKFVTTATGKAVARDTTLLDESPTANESPESATESTGSQTVASDVVGAAAFNPQRGAPTRLRVRYLTVRRDRQGAGIGSRLLAYLATRAGSRGYETVAIAVNNPAAFVAAAKAGFGFARQETGLADLVCDRAAGGPPERVDASAFREGLRRFRDRSESDVTSAYISGGPPDPVDLVPQETWD